MSWSKWKTAEGDSDARGRTPYVDWFNYLRGDAASNQSAPRDKTAEDPSQTVIADRDMTGLLSFFDSIRCTNAIAGEIDHLSGGELSAKLSELEALLQDDLGSLALPDYAVNSDPPIPFAFGENELRDIEKEIDQETVIVGVIDTGIALGHRRTRLANGRTRILAAWQQAAGPVSALSRHLPFGRELLWTDLNREIDAHSIGGIGPGWLDEEAFNRATGTLDFRNVFGHRDLGRRAAHGTHVLDAAAGFDPVAEDGWARKIRIIAVNLPVRELLGLSGHYLERFVMLGIARIVDLSDKIAEARFGEGSSLPVLINFSFGRQAGPRDGSGMLARLIDEINVSRRDAGKKLLYLTLPAGNDNLLQGNAVMPVREGTRWPLRWRAKPEDQSSNYVEIWSGPLPGPIDDNQPVALKISVSRPNEEPFDLSAGTPGQIREIERSVRVYCFAAEGGSGSQSHHRVGYIICTAPTRLHRSGAPWAPAGEWLITVSHDQAESFNVFLNVQTDQSALPDRATGLRSYFEQSSYVRFHQTSGRWVDSYDYPNGRRRRLDGSAKVKRHGSMNAIGIHRNYGVVVAGYRASDGASAPYSATGLGYKMGEGMGAPTLSMVSDDGFAHLGTLSAGARDGSAVAMQGTSFACAQIAKELAQVLSSGTANPKAWIRAQEKSSGGLIHVNDARYGYDLDPEKGGWGRYPPRPYRNLNRFGT